MMQKWECTVCGYIHTGDEPPDTCPVCGADKALFVRVEDAPAERPSDDPPNSTIEHPPSQVLRWRCTVCGYVHKGSEPPEKCPVCGADRTKFVPHDEEEEQSAEEAPTKPPTEPKEHPQQQKASPQPKHPHAAGAPKTLSAWHRVAASPYGQKLTRYHGHPIAVHIPNGVLPLSVLFTLLAALFKSESLAIAAQYNIGFVALAMPLVIGTGVIDWINGFKGRMTRVFQIKMICAAIVTVFSVVLMLWGFARPEIYSSPFPENWFFLFLHLANFVAATVAGWYGGKLVFRK